MNKKAKLTLQDLKDNYIINKQENNLLQIANKQTNEQYTNITTKMETSLLLIDKCIQDNKATTFDNIKTYDNKNVFGNKESSFKSSCFSYTWFVNDLIETKSITNETSNKKETTYNLKENAIEIVKQMKQARNNDNN